MTNYRIIPFSLAILAAGLLTFSSARSETIRMKNGDVIEGTIDKMDANILSVKTKEGKQRTVIRADIAHIDFALPAKPAEDAPKNLLEVAPKTESKYGTPALTFDLWRRAAIEGDIDKMSECYVSYRQKDMKKELKKISKEDFNKMRATTSQTDFVPGDPFYQGDRASLEVNWRLGLNGDSQVLQFALEKNDWKIIQ